MDRKRYVVDFYDMFDGWTRAWEFYKDFHFDKKEEAVARANDMMNTLDDSNKCAGEHYGVIDLVVGREVWSGKEIVK